MGSRLRSRPNQTVELHALGRSGHFVAMTLADPPGLPLLHNRTYEVRSYKESDVRMRIRGRVHDVKPGGLYFLQGEEPLSMHEMVVDIVIECPSLIIVEAGMVMETYPHRECTKIVDHYDNLVGLSITRGFTHRVRELFGGPRGCTHTTALLQAMAPVAIQSLWSMMPPDNETPVAFGERPDPEVVRARISRNRNTCHVWADDGPMFARLNQRDDLPPPLWAQRRLDELGLGLDAWYARDVGEVG